MSLTRNTMDITFWNIQVILYYKKRFLRQKLTWPSLPLHNDFIGIGDPHKSRDKSREASIIVFSADNKSSTSSPLNVFTLI